MLIVHGPVAIYGYFDSPEQTKPAYDPGLGVPCPVCQAPLWKLSSSTLGLKTISVMLESSDQTGRDTRSYFYRVHKACYDGLTEEQKTALDSGIIDLRARLRETN